VERRLAGTDGTQSCKQKTAQNDVASVASAAYRLAPYTVVTRQAPVGSMTACLQAQLNGKDTSWSRLSAPMMNSAARAAYRTGTNCGLAPERAAQCPSKLARRPKLEQSQCVSPSLFLSNAAPCNVHGQLDPVMQSSDIGHLTQNIGEIMASALPRRRLSAPTPVH